MGRLKSGWVLLALIAVAVYASRVAAQSPDMHRQDWSLSFDGANDFVVIPADPILDLRGPLTLEARVTNDADTDGQIIWRGDVAPAPARVPLRLGKGSLDLGRHLSGMLSEVRLWSIARTREDILRDMRRRMTGAEPGLTACWPLDRPSDPVARNLTGPDFGARVNRPGLPAETPAGWLR